MVISRSQFSLSPLQQGLWFQSLERRQAGVDLLQVWMHLREPLEAKAFAQAWRWAAERHIELRAAFCTNAAGQPVQEFQNSVEPLITWHHWQDLGAAGQKEKWRQLVADDATRDFNLALPPLWRIAVAQNGHADHRVLLTLHHLLIDARGLIALLRDVFAAMEAFATGAEPSARPAVSYLTYLDWLGQRDQSASQGFWRRTLAGFSTPTPLPAGATVDKNQAAAAVEICSTLSIERTSALRRFAGEQQLTLNTLVQGAWALLLGRYSGEEDVCFGAVRAGRRGNVANAEEIVGLMINTVPVRVTMPPEQPVADWLRQLRDAWVAMRPHEHVPLSEIRAWSDLPSGAPLFETIVSFLEPAWPAAMQALGEPWRSRDISLHSQPGYPLALDAASGDTLHFRLSYDPTRISTPAAERILGHLAPLLNAMAANPHRALSELPLLTAAERRQLLVDWNLTHAEFADDLCVHHLFEQQAARTPEALAVADEHRRLTYAELNRQAGALARRLLGLGVRQETCVGVCLEPSADLVVALLAVLKAGGAYVPLDPAYPAERMNFMLRDSEAAVLITQRKLAASFALNPARLICIDGPAALETPAVAAVRDLSSPDNLAYLIYTSGSTGTPKGVAVEHRSIANLIAWHQRTYQVSEADRASQIASPAFDACAWELWPYLTAGASIHFPPEETRHSPSKLARWLVARHITLSFLPTPLAEAMFDEPWPQETSLRAILTGGDRLRHWPGERLPCPLINHYGPTECTVVATAAEIPTAPHGQSTPAIGAPIANMEAYVLDRHRQIVPVGVPGELYLGGTGLARGYHRRPELTAERFVPSPFNSRERLYRTGDLVRWREDAQLEFLGRIDQQVKIRGHRIEPGEIESKLNTHPAVAESLVIARDDASGQSQLIAYVLPRRARSLAVDEAELCESLRRELPGYMIPSAIVALESWPLTANGKIDRRRLPAPTTMARTAAVAPRSAVEMSVAHIWGDVLGRSVASVHDDFFALGGHSLRAAQAVSRLNSRLNVALSVRHLFEHPTVAELARVIEQTDARDLAAVSSIPRAARPASPAPNPTPVLLNDR